MNTTTNTNTNKPLAFILSPTSVVVMVGTKAVTVAKTQMNFTAVVKALREKRWADVANLVEPAKAVAAFGGGVITIANGVVMYDGKELHNTITDRIMSMMRDGFDVGPMVKFLKNLMQNPSKSAVDELYLWLEKSQLPITDDGCFLAYKKVMDNYGSYYDHGKTMNLIGTVVEMPRNKVDDKRDVTCSYGLHFCSLSYLPHYMGGLGKAMIVKVNPADVVSIPSDYDNAKGRACKYLVVGEHCSETTEAFDKSVWTAPVAPVAAKSPTVVAKRATITPNKFTLGRLMKRVKVVNSDWTKVAPVVAAPVVLTTLDRKNEGRIAAHVVQLTGQTRSNPHAFATQDYIDWNAGYMDFVNLNSKK